MTRFILFLALSACAAHDMPGWGRLDHTEGTSWVVADMPNAEELPRGALVRVVRSAEDPRAVAIAEVVSQEGQWRGHVQIVPLCSTEPPAPGQRVQQIHPERVDLVGKCLAQVVRPGGVPEVRVRDGVNALVLDIGVGQGVRSGDRYAILGSPRLVPGQVLTLQGWASLGSCEVVEALSATPNQSLCKVVTEPDGGLGAAIYLRWMGP